MNGEHVISNNALDQIKLELLEGNHWLAYNTASYYLDNHDVYLFNSNDKANEFATNNISEFDSYKVINVKSISDVFRQIPYGDRLSKILDQSDINQTYSITQNRDFFMNQKNFEYLKEQIKYTGFGDALEATLKERMQNNPPQFHIVHEAKIGNESFLTTLHFKKSEQSDMYFFNKYNLELKPENSQEKTVQTFNINKGNNITLKEAYNLMNGRSVNKDLTNKDGQLYNTWMQLDFKQTENNGNYKINHYHQNYGYDLKSVLEKHPIKELANEQDKNRLMESLQRGNQQSVTFLEGGKENKMFIEANPRFKVINVYDNNFQRIQNHSHKEKSTPEQSIKQDTKKENLNQAEDDGDFPKSSKRKIKSKKQSIN